VSTKARTSQSKDPKFWYDLAVEGFIVQGKSQRTAESYAREIRILAKYCKKPLNQVTEDEVREYVVYRRVKCGLCATSMRILFCGLKFLFRDILGIDYPLLETMRAQSERRLPKVLTRREVVTILNHVSTPSNYAYLRTVYSCGLRLSEALNLTIHDIDGERRLLKIRGKGNKDRYVPLPEATLILLRKYWSTHKNKTLIFPALGRDMKQGPTSEKPMAIASVQGALKRAAKAGSVDPKGVRVHVLRHSYATHLLEAGVNIRAIQKYLGHANLNNTMIYLHLTHFEERNNAEVVNRLMGRVPLLTPFDVDAWKAPNGEIAKRQARGRGGRR
jgi:site-specific recombinase XerD